MRIGYGISVAGSNQRIFASAQAEQVIWKVAVFGAGTASSNGEYVWDGIEVDPSYGKPVYYNQNGSYIQYDEGFGWLIYDVIFEDGTYASSNLLDWYTGSPPWGASPAPSSALSYAQNSFISSITLIGGESGYEVSGTYTRNSGGTTEFNSETKDISWNGSYWDSYNQGYMSFDLFNWGANSAEGAPFPEVTAVVYSA